MYSENKSDVQETPRRSFIEEARRAQIVGATIATLAEIGYGKASLAQIAKRAGISTSLIPYHFKDKDDLMYQTLADIAAAWAQPVEQAVAARTTAQAKLRVYIEANLAYMGTRPDHFAALLEIVFNARNDEGVLLYKIPEEDPSVVLLEGLLAEGQEHGEFRQFDVPHMAITIRGSIEQFLGQLHTRPDLNLETYTAELVETFARATRREATDV